MILWIACTLPVPEPGETVLDQRAYRFCHEPGVYAEQAEEFCPLLDGLPEDRCPGLRASCAGAEPIDPGQGCLLTGPDAPGRDLAKAPVKPPEPLDCDQPDPAAASSLLRWVGAFAVAALLLVVARLILLWVRPAVSLPAPRVRVAARAPEPLEEEIPDVPGVSLLEQARQALEAKALGDAVLFARAAALRGLGERGRVVLHRARTDREYGASLSDPSDRGPFALIVRAVERVRWGGRSPTPEAARDAVEAASKLVGMLLVAALWLGSPPAAAQTPWRYGPHGDTALFEVLERYGYEVSWRLTPLAEIDEHTDALVLDLSGVALSDEDGAALRAWVESGHVLFVAGDATPWFPELGTAVEVDTGAAAKWAIDGMNWPALRVPEGPVGAFSMVPEPNDRWAVFGEDGVLVEAVDLGFGVVLAVGEARLFWNGSFVEPGNEVFMGEALRYGQSKLYWPLSTPMRVQLATRSVSSRRANTPTGALANARLLPFVLQLLLAWTLLALWRGWPFAPPRDPPEEGRRRFSEHVAALARRYHAQGASRRSASVYARLWLERLGVDGISRHARRAGHPDPEGFAGAIRRLAETPDGPDDRGTDLNHVETLWTILR